MAKELDLTKAENLTLRLEGMASALSMIAVGIEHDSGGTEMPIEARAVYWLADTMQDDLTELKKALWPKEYSS